MTGRTDSRMREAEEVLPLLALASKRDMACVKPTNAVPSSTYQRAAFMSYALKPESHQLSAMYGSMSATQHSNQSETESDSDGSCTASSGTGGSLQSILRIPSCRSSLKKQVSVEFALDVDSDEDDDTKRRRDGSCAARCMPRRLTIEEKAALYRVRPDLELVPTVLLLSELDELRRRRQRKLLFSILGASLILLMMIVFYYLGIDPVLGMTDGAEREAALLCELSVLYAKRNQVQEKRVRAEQESGSAHGDSDAEKTELPPPLPF
ncbi:hypothetical protein PR003_g9033 [Phytophthora rubi]|uniref:Transmembrane protein n=1 Tax=Phytophthora rubi TaxID=129364 RepID=A0A6A4FJB0_9STRA|nr:hypothetical protein PR001_g7745 [Phytophthora rubi]KAE9343344.1 hypothetical protein PR003_g9033 [Phytophthora rubi]